MARKRLGEILIHAGLLDIAGLNSALNEQRRWGGHLGRILIEMHLVSEEALVEALSTQLNLPTVNIKNLSIPREVIGLVSGELAEQNSLVPFRADSTFLDIAMSDPMNLGIIDELRIRTKLNVRAFLAGPRAIERALAQYYGRGLGTIGMSGIRDARLLGRESGPIPTVGSEVDLIPRGRPDAVAGRGSSDGAPVTVGLEEVTGAEEPGTAGTAQSARFSRPSTVERDAEIFALQDRIMRLEARVDRDENVLRKLLSLLVDKGIATREEILERIK